MKSHILLQDFLYEEVEPRIERERIQLEHTRVRELLDEYIGDQIKTHFLMGSYSRHILIRKRKDEEKYDVDIMVVFKSTLYSDEDLPKLLQLTYETCLLIKDRINKEEEQNFIEEVRIQKTSIGIRYVDNFCIDLVPALEIEKSDNYLIYDRFSGEKVVTNPEIHSNLLTEANKSGNLVPLIKLIKRWKQEKCHDIFKSFHLMLLATQYFSTKEIVTYSEALSDFFSYSYDVTVKGTPVLDPANSKNDVSSYLDKENIRYQASQMLKNALDAVNNAILYEQKDDIKRVKGYLYDLYDLVHRERPYWKEAEDMQNLNIMAQLYFGDGSVPINNRVPHKYIFSDKDVISNGWWIKYDIASPIKGNCDVYWQVVNNGQSARGSFGLRGEIFYGKSGLTQWERSQYPGRHWIDCYVIKDGNCIGKGRFYLLIQ